MFNCLDNVVLFSLPQHLHHPLLLLDQLIDAGGLAVQKISDCPLLAKGGIWKVQIAVFLSVYVADRRSNSRH